MRTLRVSSLRDFYHQTAVVYTRHWVAGTTTPIREVLLSPACAARPFRVYTPTQCTHGTGSPVPQLRFGRFYFHRPALPDPSGWCVVLLAGIVWSPGYPREQVGAVLPPNFSEGLSGCGKRCTICRCFAAVSRRSAKTKSSAPSSTLKLDRELLLLQKGWLGVSPSPSHERR